MFKSICPGCELPLAKSGLCAHCYDPNEERWFSSEYRNMVKAVGQVMTSTAERIELCQPIDLDLLKEIP